MINNRVHLDAVLVRRLDDSIHDKNQTELMQGQQETLEPEPGQVLLVGIVYNRIRSQLYYMRV